MSFRPPSRRNLKTQYGNRENADNTAAPEAEGSKPSDGDRVRLQAMMEEFELEVESRCEQMRVKAEDLGVSLTNQLHVELMKLPKSVRTMPMARFCELYQGDISQVHRAEFERHLRQHRGSVAPVSGSAAAPSIVLNLDGVELPLGDVDMLKTLDRQNRQEAITRIHEIRAMLQEKMDILMAEL